MRETDPQNIEDVPDVSADWYREIVNWADSTPAWLHWSAEVFTEAAVLVLLGLLLLSAWRARSRPDHDLAFALLGLGGTVVAYGISELSKSFKQVERPCRTLSDVVTIADCPPPGDWSFPSNHAAIAGAAVAAIAFAWRILLLPALLLGVAEAGSRVFIGVHYPHDAIVGLLLGAAVATIAVLVLLLPVTRLVHRLRRHPRLGRLLATETRQDALTAARR